ncbi:hypothetical protein [Tahibacter harae]|uniref:hypothetical protein n=1 Tax=Tahibacter harae TaxID=2963937 RepID=UPI0034E07E59
MSKSRRAQIRATLEAAQVTQRSALFEFSGGKPAAEVSEFIKRNAERAGAQYQIELVE